MRSSRVWTSPCFDGPTDACIVLSSLFFYCVPLQSSFCLKTASNKQQNVFWSTLLPGSVAVNTINILGHEPKFCLVLCLSSYIYFCVAVSDSKCELLEAIAAVIHQALVSYLSVCGTRDPRGRKNLVQEIHKQLKCSIVSSLRGVDLWCEVVVLCDGSVHF